MISAKNLKQALLVFLVGHVFLVSGAAILEEKLEKHEDAPTVIAGDGPWKAKVDELAANKDDAIHSVEHHTQQKLDDVEHKNQAEQDHVIEHEQSVVQDIESRHTLEKNIALKQELEHQLLELEKQKHELEKHTDHEMHDLEKQKHELELKKYELELLAKHKSNDLEKQKFEVSLKKHEIEMNIHVKAKDIEHQKHDEHKRIEEHEHAVNKQAHHDLHDLHYHKHELDAKHHDDLDHHKLILEKDLAFKQQVAHYPHRHWDRPHVDQYEHDLHYHKHGSFLPPPSKHDDHWDIDHKPDLHKKLEHHDEHDLIDKASITLDSKASIPVTSEVIAPKIDKKRHAFFHEPPFEHHHHFHPHPHYPPPHYPHPEYPPPNHHDFHHDHGRFEPHGKPFECGHDLEHGIPPFFNHGKPPTFDYGKPHNVPDFPVNKHEIEHDKDQKHEIGVINNDKPEKRGNEEPTGTLGPIEPRPTNIGGIDLSSGNDAPINGIGVNSQGRGSSPQDSDVQGLISDIFSSPAGGSSISNTASDTQHVDDSLSEQSFLEADTSISKGVRPLRQSV